MPESTVEALRAAEDAEDAGAGHNIPQVQPDMNSSFWTESADRRLFALSADRPNSCR